MMDDSNHRYMSFTMMKYYVTETPVGCPTIRTDRAQGGSNNECPPRFLFAVIVTGLCFGWSAI